MEHSHQVYRQYKVLSSKRSVTLNTTTLKKSKAPIPSLKNKFSEIKQYNTESEIYNYLTQTLHMDPKTLKGVDPAYLFKPLSGCHLEIKRYKIGTIQAIKSTKNYTDETHTGENPNNGTYHSFGIRHGRCIEFDENGQIKRETNYTDNKLNGTYKEFNTKTGAITCQAYYQNERLQGKRTLYDQTRITEESDWLDGKLVSLKTTKQ